MKRKKDIKQRIRAGEVRQKDVVRRLAELAFGRVNDCVKLALGAETDLDELDLSLLTEVKRSDKGLVEVKLIDRLRVLEQLAQVIGKDDEDMASFLQAVQCGGEG